MRVLACGDRAVLVEVDEPAQVLPLRDALQAAAADRRLRFEELVPAERTVLVRVPAGTDLASLAGAARQVAGQVRGPAGPHPDGDTGPAGDVTVDVRYDGPDLAEVARLTGMGVDEVVAAHTGTAWTVAFCGFSPGFGYLRAPGDPLAVPRRDSPRERVPAGSVALGGHFSAVYPQPSPGGWQLIGHTALTLWDADRDPPALLAPGQRVRFRAVAAGVSR